MGQAIILLSSCGIILVMLALFYSLWDILTGRWTKKQQHQNELDDQDQFDND